MRTFLRCAACGYEGDEEEFDCDGHCPDCDSTKLQAVNPSKERKPKVKEAEICQHQ